MIELHSMYKRRVPHLGHFFCLLRIPISCSTCSRARNSSMRSAARHLRGPRVLYRHDGRPLSVGAIRYYMAKAQRRAGLRVVDGRALGEMHILRHTFCSRLAMRGATAKSVQELAGHQHLSTTQRYMHLSPAARESAIRLLDAPAEVGDGLETGASEVPQQ